MQTGRWFLLIAVCAGLLAMQSGCAPQKKAGMQGEIIPLEKFFGNPTKAAPQLSPDGKMLAYLAPEEGVQNIWIKTVGMDDDRALTHDRNRGIRFYFWAPGGDQILYGQDKDGNENWRIYGIPLDGGEARLFTPMDSIQAHIVAVDPLITDEILIGLNNRIPQLHDIYRLNLKTGELKLEVQNNLGAIGWIADHTLTVRVASLPNPDGGGRLLHRPDAKSEWKPLTEWGYEDALSTGAFMFAKDNQTLLMISSVGANSATLRTLNVKTGEETVVASDPKWDVSGMMIHPTTYQIQAVRFSQDRAKWQALDDETRQHLEALEKLFRGDFYVTDRTLADDAWLVVYDVDNGPVRYYAYDPKLQKGTLLFVTRPELEGLPLAEMKPVVVTARDSLEIHCLLTLPPGVEPKNLPAVIAVHGGPWARDTWGYDPTAQWLANRGYAYLSVNFRGSTGFGKDFVNAGDREWGGKMQDDVTDATKWLIDQGIADPVKVGIFGGSYGGYAVLSGVTREPDLYACGVDIFGPSYLPTWLKTIPPYWEPLKPLFYKRIGDPEVDIEMLTERSPLTHIEMVKAPLLIAQGANDPRVPKAESEQFRDKLLEMGKKVEYVEFPDEGHGFARPENRLKFYAMAEKFFAEHLGGRMETPAQ